MPDDDDDEVFGENPFAGYSPHSPQRDERHDELLSDANDEPQRGKGRTRAPRGKSRAPATERGWRYMSTHMNDTEFTHALHADAIKHDSLKNSDPFCHKSGCKTPKSGLTSTEYKCAFLHKANCGALWKKVELPDGRLELWYASNVPHVRHVTSPTKGLNPEILNHLQAADWGRSLAQIAEVLASKGIGLDDTQRRALKSKKGRMTGEKTPGLIIESRQRNTFGELAGHSSFKEEEEAIIEPLRAPDGPADDETRAREKGANIGQALASSLNDNAAAGEQPLKRAREGVGSAEHDRGGDQGSHKYANRAQVQRRSPPTIKTVALLVFTPSAEAAGSGADEKSIGKLATDAAERTAAQEDLAAAQAERQVAQTDRAAALAERSEHKATLKEAGKLAKKAEADLGAAQEVREAARVDRVLTEAAAQAARTDRAAAKEERELAEELTEAAHDNHKQAVNEREVHEIEAMAARASIEASTEALQAERVLLQRERVLLQGAAARLALLTAVQQ